MKAERIIAIAAVAVLLSAGDAVLLDSEKNRDLTWDYMEWYNPGAAKILSGYTDDLTLRTASHFALLNAGVKESLLGDYPAYWDSMAKACGIDPGSDPDSKATVKDLTIMIDKAKPLRSAIKDGRPLIVNGLAAPIFEFTDGKTEGYTNADSAIMRFCVYVETEHDMDLDGKRNLVKVFLQVPRSAMEGHYKAPVIYECRVYSAGTGEAEFRVRGTGRPSSGSGDHPASGRHRCSRPDGEEHGRLLLHHRSGELVGLHPVLLRCRDLIK